MSTKFRKATSPAFNPGEIWVGVSGIRVKIISVEKYPGAEADDNHCSNYGVTYYVNASKCSEGDIVHEKDCWNFQIRYTHIGDTVGE